MKILFWCFCRLFMGFRRPCEALHQLKKQQIKVKFWIWGHITVYYNMQCASNFFKNHSTLFYFKASGSHDEDYLVGKRRTQSSPSKTQLCRSTVKGQSREILNLKGQSRQIFCTPALERFHLENLDILKA